MPILGVLHILVAIFFAVHALRTGRNMYWLFVLLAFPFLGSVVYFFAEYLPEIRHSAIARKATGVVTQLIDPKRELREAQADFDRTPTVDNRARLAEALLGLGQADAAVEHYRQCLAGPYAKDAKFRRGLARAQQAAGRHADAAATLEALFADDPAQARGEASLWLAQALSEVDAERALAAFERADELHHTTETLCAHGLFLARIGRVDRARQLLQAVLHNARVGTSHSRELNRSAIDQARAALKALDERAAPSA